MGRVKILQTENSRTQLTVSERAETHPTKLTQFLASTLATLSALSMGMCLTWSSPAIPMLQQKNSTLKITDEQGAWVASLLTLGAFVGAIPAGAIANLIGRKRTLQILAVPIFASWMIIAFGGCVYTLYIARFMAGIAIGGVSVAAPMYVAELAHTSIRGTLGTFFQVQITVGLLIEYILGGTLGNFTHLAVVSSIFPIIFLVAFSFMPETPAYLYGKRRFDDARASLIFFRGNLYNVDEELLKIGEDLKEASVNRSTFCELLGCRATVNGLIVCLGLMVFQQLSGINAVLFYTRKIFDETGSSMSPNNCSILVGAVQMIATMLSTLLIDRTGRKILLFVSSLVMGICLVTLGAYFQLKQSYNLAYLSILPLISLALFIVLFSIGFGPIPWMMMGEIFTPKSKGAASSLSAAVNWLLAFTVTNQFQNMVDHMGIGITFIIFGWICSVATIFVGTMVPETKGRDIDQVQTLLLRNRALNCVGRCLGRRKRVTAI